MFSDFSHINKKVKSSLEKLVTDDFSENEFEGVNQEETAKKDCDVSPKGRIYESFERKRSINTVVRLLLIGVLVVVSVLAVIKISSFAFGTHKERKPKEAKAVHKIISAELTDIKDVFKGSFLTVPYCGYRVKHYTRDDDKSSQTVWQKIGGAALPGKEEDVIIYIDRGFCKLGIDFEKVKIDVNEKEKKLYFHCPPVEIISFEWNNENSLAKVIDDAKTVNSSRFNTDRNKEVHKEIEEEARCEILTQYSAKCQESIRQDLTDYISLMVDGYMVEVDFE